MKISEVSFTKFLAQHRAKLALFIFLPTMMVVTAILVSGHYCEQAAVGRIFSSVEQVPKNEVAVVLGTGKTTRSGNPNLHFQQRIDAAVSLYRSGKVHHLLVSGDNHIKTYDEPDDMRDTLIAAGVPADAITCDYAGFRTLDSITRAGLVFGLSKFTIVSEEFHCPRAVWIACAHGLDAVAFAAPDVNSARWSLRVKFRELFARAWCGVDLYVLNRGPKFSGPREPILLTTNP